MKRISVKFQQQEQTYRSLHAAARSLLSSKGRVFLLFLLFYKVLTNFLFVPALQLIWALTLRFAPIRYLNNKTASRIFASPAIIGCIVVLAVLAAFWSLYEIAAMLQLLTRVRHGEPLRVGAVFRDAFCSLVRVFLPQNLPLLLYGAALISLTNFFLAANHLTQFAVPEYLWGLLKARAANRLLFALAVLFVLALLLDGLVVLPKFLLERKSFGCAFAESLRVLRGRAGQLLALSLRWMLTAAVRTGLMLLCGALLFYCVILGVGFASTAALLALSRAALLIELPFLCMLMDCAMTAAQSTLTEALYEVTRQSDAAQPIICSASPAPHREQTVLAGMMACAALVTCGVAAVYLLFPQTQPLQSVLGLSDPVITYHRGYSSRAPENTMAAFETALEHGSPRIELDVQMTADGVAVVTHDTSLKRCTGKNAKVYDLTFAEIEALDAGLKTILTIAEHVPVHDMMLCYRLAHLKGARLFGPNSFGIISPGKCKAGFMAHRIFAPGNIGLMSRSATNCYETVFMLTNHGLGQSTCIGVGGDMIPGSTFVDLLPDFNADPETKAIVIIGEIGGNEEELAAEYLKKHVSKPVIALIAGKNAPKGRSMGHAGAIVSADGAGSAESKERALREAGAYIAENTQHILDICLKLKEEGKL